MLIDQSGELLKPNAKQTNKQISECDPPPTQCRFQLARWLNTTKRDGSIAVNEQAVIW